MNIRILALCAALVALIASCGTTSIGYFEIQPVSGSVDRLDETLYIDFGSQVKNNFSVDQAGIRTLNVKDFRQSFLYALDKTFSSRFSDVKPYRNGERGFVLRVNHVKSSWLIGRNRSIVRENDTLTFADFACFMCYSSVLYRDGKPVTNITGDVRIKPDFSTTWRIDRLFEQAVKQSCEDIARKVEQEL